MCRRDIGVCVLPPAAPFEDPAGVGIGGVKPVYRYGRPAAPNDPVVRRRSVPSLATAAEDCAAVMAREREGRGERSVCAPKWPICTGPFPCCRRKRGFPTNYLVFPLLVFDGTGNAIPITHGVATWRISPPGPVPLGAHGARLVRRNKSHQAALKTLKSCKARRQLQPSALARLTSYGRKL